MRSDIIRIYKAVHTWTGIITGMALFIAFYAGALTVFQEPIARWASPPAEGRAVPLQDAQALIVGTLQAHPEAARDFTIHLREAEHLPARMSWRVREQGADDHDETSARHYVASLDAGAGVKVEEARPSQLSKFIDVLHRVVGLPVDSDPNRWIMGVVAALYTLALVSGVIVLLPSLVKDFFALRVGRNLKRMWLDAHNVVGIVSLPFHLVMALTAVVFAFHDGIYYLQDKMFHEGRLAGNFQGGRSAAAPPSSLSPPDPATMLPPAELVARAQAVSPDFEPETLQYQNVIGPRAAVRVWGKDAAALSPRALGGFVAIDPYSGRVLSTDYLPGRQDGAHTTVSSFFALHMAAFGGTPVQWMYFVLGLAGVWLFYSGNLLWVESRRRKAARGETGIPAQRRDVRLMASATVGVCLGCICGISLTIAAGKWLHGHVEDVNAWHRYIYYAVFFCSIAWAFARGAAVASVHLLQAAAACTLAIPLTTLLAWSVPSLGMWAHGSAAALGVDATALGGAFCFAWMARATARRVRSGPRDSVWSAHAQGPAVAPVADGAASPGRAGVESGPV
ncbi:PepSY-associated TM helix domain-containing protein [Thauera sinica]|uniref:PepSY-associated TM helix domain-containing protein n=1 Tax=Thauera sinica TaxID=2665146 RepID=A0ABW1AR69_9RHOO|nr:PepSY-associated TM helix domain-containing protein [Thauera sp. K11]ATE59666.1 peptidase [Thauera sp. K11]